MEEDILEGILQKYDNIRRELNEDDVIADFERYSKLNKSLKEIENVAELYRSYKAKVKILNEDKDLLKTEKDEGMCNLIKEDIADIMNELSDIEEKIKTALILKDPNDSKDVIFEIHAGVGGEEACIFAMDLFKMYSHYFESKGWKIDIVECSPTASGYRDIVCNVKGNNVYGVLKYESGVHRVQRIPKTESNGRIHTSVASVVVLPEINAVEIKLNMKDIRKDTYCSSGAGGQSVNTTYSAIRLTHIPSGLVVTCQDERSQIKNYEKALNVLRARLYRLESEKQADDINSQKKSIVKTGDRHDKIRTYNYHENRVTDHRINFSVYNLDYVMDGFLDEIFDKLKVLNYNNQNNLNYNNQNNKVKT